MRLLISKAILRLLEWILQHERKHRFPLHDREETRTLINQYQEWINEQETTTEKDWSCQKYNEHKNNN